MRDAWEKKLTNPSFISEVVEPGFAKIEKAHGQKRLDAIQELLQNAAKEAGMTERRIEVLESLNDNGQANGDCSPTGDIRIPLDRVIDRKGNVNLEVLMRTFFHEKAHSWVRVADIKDGAVNALLRGGYVPDGIYAEHYKAHPAERHSQFFMPSGMAVGAAWFKAISDIRRKKGRKYP